MLQDMVGFYESGDQLCRQDGDPLSVIVRMADSEEVVRQHVSGHGLPANVNDDLVEQTFTSPDEWFRYDDYCVYNEINQGSNPAFVLNGFDGCYSVACIRPRWHARGYGAEGDPQNAGLVVYALSPHRDELTTDCDPYAPGILGTHYVPQDGYQTAKNYVVELWIASGHHNVIDYQFWGDFKEHRKCGPNQIDVYPRTDGWVYLLGLCGELPGVGDC